MTKTKSMRTIIINLLIFAMIFCGSAGLGAVETSAANTVTVTLDTGEVILQDVNEDGYYEISTADELYAFAQHVNDGNTKTNAILTADIDLNPGYTFTENQVTYGGETVSSGFKSWTPIGNTDNQYVGTFNGNGKTVSGLYFFNNKTKYVAFFSCVGSQGTVKNLGIENSLFSAYMYNASIVANNHGTVTNCYNSGCVKSSSDYVGGIVALNQESGVITYCYNTGDVLGSRNYYTGGIAGQNYGEIRYCYVLGAVKSVTGNGWYYGGIVGGAHGGTVSTCYFAGELSSEDTKPGGLVGQCRNCIVENCYFDYETAGTNYIGAIQTDYSGKVIDCSPMPSSAFKYGEVAYILNGDQSRIVFYQICGKGFPAFSGPQVYPQYENSCKITGYGNTPSDTIPHAYVNGICTEIDGEQHYEAPSVSDEIYLISNVGQLFWTVNAVKQNNTLSAKLISDIDLSGYEWTPIENFMGTLNGDYHVVRNMEISASGSANAGFFSSIGDRAIVHSLGFENASVENTGTGYTGILAGEVKQYSNIYDCYTQGTVSGANNKTAGIIAKVDIGTNIYNCYTSYQNAFVSVSSDKIDRVYSADSEGAEVFASGELTYKLNAEQTNIRWYQRLGENADAYPTFTAMENSTVKLICDGTTVTYSNTESESNHDVVYSVMQNGLVQSCTVEKCNHRVTVSLNPTVDENSIWYTGSEIRPYETVYVGVWIGEPLEILFENNINIGVGRASITAGGQTFTKEFTISKRNIRFTVPLQHVTSEELLDFSQYTVEGLAEGHVIGSMQFSIEREGFFLLQYVILSPNEEDVTDNYFAEDTAHGYFHLYRAEEYRSDGSSHWFTCDTEGCNIKVLQADCSGGIATCIEAATCSVCKTKYRDIDPNAHAWDDGTVVSVASCAQKGIKTYTCTHNSAHTYTEDVDALGHTEETVASKAPTCTEKGLTDGKKCSVCDETLTAQTEIAALGHKYDHACDADCNTCGEERTPAEHADADENNACDECGAELPKDGLSGGAIAGIVIGSVAILGGGGFALWWFVFRKKKVL